MKLESLKRWRLIAPGVMMFVVFPPLFHTGLDIGSWFEDIASIKALVDALGAIVLGALYEIFDIRNRFWRRWLTPVNDQIKSALLDMCPSTKVQEKAPELREGRGLLYVFYGLVDNDHTLQEKAKRVRFNGLLWTSAIDAAVVSLSACAVYLLAYLVLDRIHLAIIGLALAVIWMLCRFALTPRVTQRHMQLSAEQLEFIALRYKTEVCRDLEGLADAI